MVFEKRALVKDIKPLSSTSARVEDLIGSANARKWCRSVGLADIGRLERNLEQRGISVYALQALDPVDVEHCSPEWVSLLDPLLSVLDHEEPLRLEIDSTTELMGHVLEYLSSRIGVLARNRLAWGGASVISGNAIDDVVRYLAESSRDIMWQVVQLEVELLVARARRSRTSICEIGASWWRDLSRHYPVLFRYLSVTLQKWLLGTRSLFRRLQDDYEMLNDLSGPPAIRQVESISAPLSDPHDGHLAVRELRFTTGVSWFYKPRDLRSDTLHQFLLEWVKAEGGPDTSIRPTIILRGSYGWMRGVPRTSCLNAEEVERYYRRMGMHLCIAHVFNMRDLHHENVVASGEYPVVVDGETFLTPEVLASSSIDDGSGMAAGDREFWHNSVFRTSMLPRWTSDERGKTDYAAAIQVLVQGDANAANPNGSDCACRMTGGNDALPRLNGSAIGAENFVDVIVSGFRTMADFLMKKREDLLGLDTFWAGAQAASARVIFRTTSVYWKLRKSLLHPSNLSSGLDASIRVECLLRDRVPEPGTVYWSILEEEQRMLLDLDIPLFSAAALIERSRDLSCEMSPIFKEPHCTSIRRRISDLRPAEVEKQQVLIQMALLSDKHAFGLWKSRPRENQPDFNEGVASDYSAGLRAARASELFQSIEYLRTEALADCEEAVWASAIYGENATPGWIGRVFNSDVDAWRVTPLGPGLFDGVTGILVFLASASLFSKTQNSDRNRAIVGVAREMLEVYRENRAKRMRSGLGFGIGSTLWGLTAVRKLMSDANLNQAVDELLDCLEIEEIISMTTADDALMGLSGFLMALISVDVRQSIDLERTIDRCWARLIAAADACVSQQSARPFQGGHFGMAHGLAGIALALIRAAGFIGDSGRREKALQYYRYLGSQHKLWLDLPREHQAHTFRGIGPLSWCNGLIGSAASMLSAYKLWADPEILDSVLPILDQISSWPLLNNDTLCCGNCGRIALLQLAASTLRNESYSEMANTLKGTMLARTQTKTGFRLNVPVEFTNPTLYQGLCGVGQTLSANTASSLLTWDLEEFLIYSQESMTQHQLIDDCISSNRGNSLESD